MKKILFALVPLVLICMGIAHAQTAAPASPKTTAANTQATAAAGKTPAAGASGAPAAIVLNSLPFEESLFFNPLEIRSILTASAGGAHGRDPSLQKDNATNISLHRTIALAGVLYRQPGDWTIWLNGRKVTPSRWLPEIMDVQVHDDQVMLKWFDIGMAKIISITLRPHQTYDIVTGLLLPG